MAHINKERFDQLTYADGPARATCYLWLDGAVEISGYGQVELTPKQARRFAEKILGWCDEIEGGK